MAQFVKLTTENLKKIRSADPMLSSYNIEMTAVTGGSFWKAYSPGVMAGTEKFPAITSLETRHTVMQWYDPIDTSKPRLLKLAKALGPVWVRVSGTWATKTYYDFDNTGVTPEGYQNRLTKDQWLSLLDFVKAVGAKLQISVANCDGLHSAEEPWNPSQAKLIFDSSKEYGHPIDAVEFTNEPNTAEESGCPKGYTVEHFRRDQDIFHKWVRETYPGTILVGPCAGDPGVMRMGPKERKGLSISDVTKAWKNADILSDCTEKLDAYSYHYYNGLSERFESLMPADHWPVEAAHTEEYLEMAGLAAKAHIPTRDKFVSGGQMWITESADSAGGGSTWASTYLDVLRTLNELGSFATITDGIIFHNTLASSDYGWLKHGTYESRPNYFAVLLWNTLMGTTVYDSGEPIREGAHVYCHSRKDGKDGCEYLVINNSLTDATTVELPREADCYTLAGRDGMRSAVMTLNGHDLVLDENDEIPDLSPVKQAAGTVELSPGSCTFFVL